MLGLICKALAFYVIYWVLWKSFRRFAVKTPIDNIPGPKAKSWFGVLPQLFNRNAWAFHDEIILKYGRVTKIEAVLGEKQLYVTDPLALHHIIVKEQAIYEETEGFLALNNLTFGAGLLSTLGDQHKKQRRILNPVFSSARMREMVPIFNDVAEKLHDALNTRAQNGPVEIDILSWVSRTALELVGQSGFGYSFDSLTEDKQGHPFAAAVKRLEPAKGKLAIARVYLVPLVVKIGTPSFRRRVMDLIPWKVLHDIRDVVDILDETSLAIYNSAKAALAQGDDALSNRIARGKDIMSVLLKANREASDKDKISEVELMGQISTIIFAATDTTSSALSRILFLLSKHQDVQDKLREEVWTAFKDKEQLSYDDLNDLTYLDAICRETLRLYPPVPIVARITRQDTVLPLGAPIQGLDGREISEIPIENNTNIIVSIIGCNRDPTLWGDDSLEWKPERWLRPLPETITNAHVPGVYSNLMTFLGGGRACIGFKFSQLEMKVVLTVLLKSFKFSLTNAEVVWQWNAITSPAVRDREGAQLPLVVELVNKH
ncbi:cytochrome P450 [Crepidotus variabilis]|uniref:Cytochrome P450 n=1 Tax=Crepidotus variabilis TaxID=179855 RepID=A0A9P6EIL3_9AGAR|nr:cytochrome P450 [Crepidotus variabilis]